MPFWNRESVYFISKTALGAHEVVKARLYQDKFDNSIKGFTNSSDSTLKTSGSGSVSSDGISIYDDKTLGGSMELESTRFATHTLRLVTHFKKDRHLSHEASGLVVEEFKDTLVTNSRPCGNACAVPRLVASRWPRHANCWKRHR